MLIGPSIAFSLLAIRAVLAAEPEFEDNAPTVMLKGVKLVGRTIEGVEESFGGIPYAQPPLGMLRYSPPVAYNWTSKQDSTYNATGVGNRCLQMIPNATYPTWGSGRSEDCLAINVYRPIGTTGEQKLPVLAWIHGGWFMTSSAAWFDPSLIIPASTSRGTPVIFVSFGWRLNALGFPLGPEAEREKIQNLGLQDQIMALRWIQENIAAFGGDPTKVTLGGESAGAASTAFHMFNTEASKLFHGAILISGGASLLPAVNSTYIPTAFPTFAKDAGCENTSEIVACMRQANSTALETALSKIKVSAAGPFGPFGPVSDGIFVPTYRDIFHGDYSSMPFISGTLLDEGTYFTPKTGIVSESDIARDLPNWTRIDPSQLLARYPAGNPNYSSPYGSGVGEGTGREAPAFKRESSILGDVIVLAPFRQFLSRTSSKGSKAYGFLFADTGSAGWIGPGVSHGADLPYLFPNFYQLVVSGKPPVIGAEEKRISGTIIDYFLSFVTSQAPNDGKGAQRPVWNQYSTETPSVMQFLKGNLTAIPDTFRKEQTDYIISQL